jgi:hypothetical protein
MAVVAMVVLAKGALEKAVAVMMKTAKTAMAMAMARLLLDGSERAAG